MLFCKKQNFCFQSRSYSSSFPSDFSLIQGLQPRIILLYRTLPTTSSSPSPTASISSFITSIYLIRLPLLSPGSFIFNILLPIYIFLIMCPYHHSLPSLVFKHSLLIFSDPQIYSSLILSPPVTPNANLNVLNSATFISFSCLFVSATVSRPYNIIGLTAVLYTSLDPC